MHDLLWRDEAASSTRAGIRFHEARLRLIRAARRVRVFTTSPLLRRPTGRRRASTESRLYRACALAWTRTSTAAERPRCDELLASRGVRGPFTLYAGTREPRKNIETLLRPTDGARDEYPELGPLVLVGPVGGETIDTGDAVVLGLVAAPDVARPLPRRHVFVATSRAPKGGGCRRSKRSTPGARVVASRDHAECRDQRAASCMSIRSTSTRSREASSRALEQGATTRASRHRRAVGRRSHVAQRAPWITWRRGDETRPGRLGRARARRGRGPLRGRTRRAGSGAPGHRDDARHASRRHAAMARRGRPRRTSPRSFRTSTRARLLYEAWSLGTRRSPRDRSTCGTRRTTRCRIAGPRRPS